LEGADGSRATILQRAARCGPPHIPVVDASIDAVVINQVFCNMYRSQYSAMIAEISRVLGPGGKLLQNESNNPSSPEVKQRLMTLSARLEGEDGSYFRSRL
jgi:ubiquinone/menaquinone biosynthesis C-methylase UbiE